MGTLGRLLGYLGQLLGALGRLWSDLGRQVGAKMNPKMHKGDPKPPKIEAKTLQDGLDM